MRHAPTPTSSDVRVPRVHGPPVAYAEEDEHATGEREEDDRDDERDRARRPEPREPIGLRRDGVLERREAAVHRLSLVLDLVAEAREPLAAAVEHAVDDVGDVSLPCAQLAILPGGELEVGDRLVAQTAPDGLLRRRRHGLVDAAAHEVEQRGRELVRARLASLSQQRRARVQARCRSAAPARTRGRSPSGARVP